MAQEPALPPEAVAALHQGNKIEAIKLVRERQGVDLKEAKQRVEQYLRTEPSVQASYEEMRSRSGGGRGWLWVIALGAATALAYWWQSAGGRG